MAKKKSSNGNARPLVVDPSSEAATRVAIPRKRTRAGIGKHTRKVKPWEPSARQWAMYEAVTRGGSYRTVGAAFAVSHAAVGEMCGKIDDLLALHYMDKIRRLRARHTQTLEVIVDQAMQAWERSKAIAITETVETEGVPQADGTAAPTGLQKKRRQEKQQHGDSAYLSEARSALADIRKIWAADKNPKIIELEGEEEYRVAGKPLEQVLEEEILKLQTTLTITRTRAIGE